MKDVKGALEAFWGASRRDSQPMEPIAIEVPETPVPAEAIVLPKPPRRRPSILPLVLGILCLGAGAGLLVTVEPPRAAQR